jgi:8-oxo-dGTP diphosphatase
VPAPLPYKIAVLCYLFDEQGRVLMLHRRKPPNRDLHSPVGGKLEQGEGESPTACAAREIEEETGLIVDPADLHLTGLVSETAYEGQTHWLMFLYELTRPVTIERTEFDEGTLEWFAPEAIDDLPLPDSDRRVIWPLFWQHRGGFFAAHLDCTTEPFTWRLEQSHPPAPTPLESRP